MSGHELGEEHDEERRHEVVDACMFISLFNKNIDLFCFYERCYLWVISTMYPWAFSTIFTASYPHLATQTQHTNVQAQISLLLVTTQINKSPWT